MTVQGDRVELLRGLHVGGCRVMPNLRDAGNALALQHLRFKALAMTSAGCAWSSGRADNRRAPFRGELIIAGID